MSPSHYIMSYHVSYAQFCAIQSACWPHGAARAMHLLQSILFPCLLLLNQVFTARRIVRGGWLRTGPSRSSLQDRGCLKAQRSLICFVEAQAVRCHVSFELENHSAGYKPEFPMVGLAALFLEPPLMPKRHVAAGHMLRLYPSHIGAVHRGRDLGAMAGGFIPRAKGVSLVPKCVRGPMRTSL